MQICAAQRAGALRRPHAESASHLVARLRHTSFVKKVVLCRCLHVNVSKSPTSNAATEVAIRLDRSRGRHESVLRNMGAAGSGSGDTNPDNSCRLCPSRTLFPTPNQHIFRRPRALPPVPSRARPRNVTRSRLRKRNSTASSLTTPWPGRVAEGGMSPEEQGGGMGLDECESDT